MTIIKCLIDHTTFLVQSEKLNYETHGKSSYELLPMCFESCTTCTHAALHQLKLLLAAASSVKCCTTVNDVRTRLTRTQLAICVLLHCWPPSQYQLRIGQPILTGCHVHRVVCLELAHLMLIDLQPLNWTTGQRIERDSILTAQRPQSKSQLILLM